MIFSITHQRNIKTHAKFPKKIAYDWILTGYHLDQFKTGCNWLKTGKKPVKVVFNQLQLQLPIF
jgi:hypothetical protein